MQVKLLHDLVEEMAGVGTGRIVEILFGKKDVNEFLVAKKMNLTINQVRNILYKLSAEGLVSFVRKKDKRKGWYIYYWTLKTEKCLIKLEQALLKKIDEHKVVLSNRELKRYYSCKSCGIEFNEEKALEHGFTCEECAEVYELSDNRGSIRDTKAKITKTEKELQLIQDELKKVRSKEQKKRVLREKKEEKAQKEKKEMIKKAKVEAKKLIEKKNAKGTKSAKKTKSAKGTKK
jgi:transcription factor E